MPGSGGAGVVGPWGGQAQQQIGEQWRDSDYGGGGGGGNGGGGEYHSTEQPSISAAVKAKDQASLVNTGYAIQPLINPGNTTDIGPVEAEMPRAAKNLLPPQQDTSAADAAATGTVYLAASTFTNTASVAASNGPTRSLRFAGHSGRTTS